MKRQSKSRLLLTLASLLASISLFAAAWLWFVPSGPGETRPSPDGRYEAQVMDYTAGTITGRRKHYLEIRVTDKNTNREIWQLVYNYPPGTAVPDYGERDKNYITWAPDSSSVTIILPGNQSTTFMLPP